MLSWRVPRTPGLDLRQAFVAAPGLCPHGTLRGLEELWNGWKTAPSTNSQIGERVSITRTVTNEDVERFAEAAGALDPDAEESGLATTNGFMAIATGAGWAQAMVGAMLATRFPGPRHGADAPQFSMSSARSPRATRSISS